MGQISSYRDLIVWQRALQLSTNIYKLTATFPKNEIYGLSSQMQRCAVSIPSNIAEGHERNSRKEFIQFIAIAKGSAGELETQLLIAKEVHNVIVADFINETVEIRRMLQAITKKLKSS